MVYCQTCDAEVEVDADESHGFSCCVQCGRVVDDHAFASDVQFSKVRLPGFPFSRLNTPQSKYNYARILREQMAMASWLASTWARMGRPVAWAASQAAACIKGRCGGTARLFLWCPCKLWHAVLWPRGLPLLLSLVPRCARAGRQP